jgi:signal transduction histidine kinase
VSLILELGMAQAEVLTEDDELRTQLGHFTEQARDALRELRDLSRGIHPAILAEGGLGQALRVLTRRSPIPVQLDQRIEERLPDQVEISAFYILAEALTNAAKHSGASVITVSAEVEQVDGTMRLEIADDGVGGAEFSGGTGLMGLKDRVDALGGRIDCTAREERGPLCVSSFRSTGPTANPEAGACSVRARRSTSRNFSPTVTWSWLRE